MKTILLTLLLAGATLAQNVTISASVTITAAEARALQSFVQSNFAAAADANADGTVSSAEARAWGSAKMAEVVRTFTDRALDSAEEKAVDAESDRQALTKAHADALTAYEAARAALKAARLARIE